jgi:hypothetical protein
MSSQWTHSICEQCWVGKNPGREPHRVVRESRFNADKELCCYCGREHQSGIFVREDPSSVACAGISGYHKGEADGGS